LTNRVQPRIDTDFRGSDAKNLCESASIRGDFSSKQLTLNVPD
jgi:hypothetical protein